MAERDRRLARPNSSEESEINSMRLDLAEKTAKLQELSALNLEEATQLGELRKIVEVKEQQINGLVQQLEEKTKQYELVQHALERHIGDIDMKVQLRPVFDSYRESLSQVMNFFLFFIKWP